jgi:hypothetical protein
MKKTRGRKSRDTVPLKQMALVQQARSAVHRKQITKPNEIVQFKAGGSRSTDMLCCTMCCTHEIILPNQTKLLSWHALH